ncbi:hypothetical protein [Methylomarinum vadi]|uniref:hypothetical protein n=1 Tax=Methylomarinum vadi TaxID=438855 RepID=UPI001363CC0E|nr:hypothetical protein [Methylomarinum vadi]
MLQSGETLGISAIVPIVGANSSGNEKRLPDLLDSLDSIPFLGASSDKTITRGGRSNDR